MAHPLANLIWAAMAEADDHHYEAEELHRVLPEAEERCSCVLCKAVDAYRENVAPASAEASEAAP